jgi:Fur family transcriptional regulator, zinc uptake regulator
MALSSGDGSPNVSHDHAHHQHVSAEEHCARRGLKLTELRRQVYDALASAPGAMGAYDLIDALADQGRKRLAPVSIYRALDFLLDAGLAHKIASRNAFVACPHRHDSEELVVFLICDNCGRVSESTSESVVRGLGEVARRAGFHPKGQVVEMHGRCATCAPEAVMTA